MERNLEQELLHWSLELEQLRYRLANKPGSPETGRVESEIDELKLIVAGREAELLRVRRYECDGFGWPGRDERGRFIESTIGTARSGYHN